MCVCVCVCVCARVRVRLLVRVLVRVYVYTRRDKQKHHIIYFKGFNFLNDSDTYLSFSSPSNIQNYIGCGSGCIPLYSVNKLPYIYVYKFTYSKCRIVLQIAVIVTPFFLPKINVTERH